MDEKIISGMFFEWHLPKDKMYLRKYFKTFKQQAYLKYVFVMGTPSLFTEHTGVPCCPRNLKLLRRKLLNLEAAYLHARNTMNLEKLELITSGKYKIKKNNK